MAGILVGVDGSEHSRRALVWAVQEAARHHLPLTVLTVRPPEPRPATHIFWNIPDDLEEDGQDSDRERGFARLIQGSVSSKVTHHAACPTVVIPGRH